MEQTEINNFNARTIIFFPDFNLLRNLQKTEEILHEQEDEKTAQAN